MRLRYHDLLDARSWVMKCSFTMADDLNAMSVFVMLAEAKGFRAAGERLGVSASAVSQAIRKLEEQLGVVLEPRGVFTSPKLASDCTYRCGRRSRRCGPRSRRWERS